jgi:hypothetical protein
MQPQSAATSKAMAASPCDVILAIGMRPLLHAGVQINVLSVFSQLAFRSRVANVHTVTQGERLTSRVFLLCFTGGVAQALFRQPPPPYLIRFPVDDVPAYSGNAPPFHQGTARLSLL